MSTGVKRTVQTNANGYREVDLEFRKARALALEAAEVHNRPNRLVCPVLDAARSSGAYGAKPLKSTDEKGLDAWSDGLGLDRSAIAGIAFLSGPWYKVLSNNWTRTFEEDEVNTGLVKYLKNDVNTGIISKGVFDQEALNVFVWAVHPDKKGTAIDNTFLHSEAADDLYIDTDSVEVILENNCRQNKAYRDRTDKTAHIGGVGPKISNFEMEGLLLGKLGQAITAPGAPDKTPDDGALEEDKPIYAMSVRDLHDLYKYGVYPALKEEKLLEAGLIEESSPAMSGTASSTSS